MICSTCKEETKVTDSRQTAIAIRRRRECACGRFTTYEVREEFFNTMIQLDVNVLLDSGRPVLRLAQRINCLCGNEARYTVEGEAAPRFCGVCDIKLNGGRGRRWGDP